MASAGALSKSSTHTFSGTLASAGAPTKQDAKPLAGVAASSGTIAKLPKKVFAATVASVGVITSSGIHVFTRTLSASMASAGAMVRFATKPLVGTVASGSSNTVLGTATTGTIATVGHMPDIRSQHTILDFNNAFWVIGGTSGTPRRTVFTSTDGTSWSEAGTNVLPFGVYGHGSVVFNSKMWMIGGFTSNFTFSRKVYSSTDGTTWTEVGTDALPVGLYQFGCVVFNSKMWVIGGSKNVVAVRKVYSSSDGITWTEAGTDALPNPIDHMPCVAFNGYIWILSGQFYTQVLRSSDGITWNAVGTATFPQSNFGSNAFVMDNHIWVLGGGDDQSTERRVYQTEEGLRWLEVGTNLLPQGLNDPATCVRGNTFFVTGGYNADNQQITQSNTVYKFTMSTPSVVTVHGFEKFVTHLTAGALTFIGAARKLFAHPTSGSTASTGAITRTSEKTIATTLAPNADTPGSNTWDIPDPLPVQLAGATITFFNGKFFLIGTQGPFGPVAPKIFSTVNGTNWVEEGVDASPLLINNHTSLVFNNKLWIIGGVDGTLNAYSAKVFWTADGITWNEAGTNALPVPIAYHGSCVFNNKMWVVGGITGAVEDTILDTVYYSSDGITWTEAGSHTLPYAIESTPVVTYNGKMWILGGDDYIINTMYQQVLQSSDGINCTAVGTDTIPYAQYGPGVVVHDNKMWVLSGFTAASEYNPKALYSTDGLIWNESDTDVLAPGSVYGAAGTDGTTLLMGGGYSPTGVTDLVHRLVTVQPVVLIDTQKFVTKAISAIVTPLGALRMAMFRTFSGILHLAGFLGGIGARNFLTLTGSVQSSGSVTTTVRRILRPVIYLLASSSILIGLRITSSNLVRLAALIRRIITLKASDK
jgi:N-acetylneuraminic acid mutarotase